MIPLCNIKFQKEQDLMLEVDDVSKGVEMISGDLELIDQRENELVYEKQGFEEKVDQIKQRPQKFTLDQLYELKRNI